MRRQTLVALGVAVVLGLLAVYFANIFLARPSKAAVPAGHDQGRRRRQFRWITGSKSRPTRSVRRLSGRAAFRREASAISPSSARGQAPASRCGRCWSTSRSWPTRFPAKARRVDRRFAARRHARRRRPHQRCVRCRRLRPAERRRRCADHPPDVGAAGDAGTDVLLQNVRVIATDQNAQGADGQPIVAKTATLEVNPIDAQKLALAQQVGQLSLSSASPAKTKTSPASRPSASTTFATAYYGGGYPAAAPRGWRFRSADHAVARRDRSCVAPAGPAAAPSMSRSLRGTVGNSYEVGGYGS